MKTVFKTVLWLSTIAALSSLPACFDNKEAATQNKSTWLTLDVYKSPTCGCCTEWVDHVEAAGFETLLHHPSDLISIKDAHGIPADYQACHTAVSNQGYVFEGHIPANLMQRFLENPPENAIGLAVPGMPMGSPGMEMGDHYDDYVVLLLNKDGSSAIYEEIRGHEEIKGQGGGLEDE